MSRMFKTIHTKLKEAMAQSFQLDKEITNQQAIRELESQCIRQIRLRRPSNYSCLVL